MEVTQETKEKPIQKTEPGTYATKFFIFYLDRDTKENQLTEFNSKEEFDEWNKKTNVEIKRVIRGREKEVKARYAFF